MSQPALSPPPVAPTEPDRPTLATRAELSYRPHAASWAIRLGWAVAVGLVAWNARWLWQQRPIADLKTVATWVEAGRMAEAEPALRLHLERSPNHGEARLLLARVLAAGDDLEGCAEQLAAVPYWWPGKSEARFREGQAWLQLDRAAAAEAAWRAYVRDDPNHPVGRPFLARAETELINVYTLEDRWDEARAVVWASYDRAESAEAREELAIMALRTFLERSRPSAAAETLRRFVAADPGDLAARRALARACQAIGRAAEADEQLSTCFAAAPDDLGLWRDRLDILDERGDVEGLKAAIARLPAEADGDPAIWKHRAAVLRCDRDLDGAAAAYRRAIALAPNESDSHYQLAQILEEQGRGAEAAPVRERYETLRAARADLPDALTTFLDARRGLPDAPPKAEAAAKVAALCRTLGWTREADAWDALARPAD